MQRRKRHECFARSALHAVHQQLGRGLVHWCFSSSMRLWCRGSKKWTLRRSSFSIKHRCSLQNMFQGTVASSARRPCSWKLIDLYPKAHLHRVSLNQLSCRNWRRAPSAFIHFQVSRIQNWWRESTALGEHPDTRLNFYSIRTIHHGSSYYSLAQSMMRTTRSTVAHDGLQHTYLTQDCTQSKIETLIPFKVIAGFLSLSWCVDSDTRSFIGRWIINDYLWNPHSTSTGP